MIVGKPVTLLDAIYTVEFEAMTRSELIDSIAQRFPQLVRKDAELSVTEIITAISRSLAAKERVEIRGFGSFELIYRAPRNGRNPKTGQSVSIPGKHVPHFKAGKELRERIAVHHVNAHQH